MRLIVMTLAALALCQSAAADPLDGKAARKLLFKPKGADLVIVPGALSAGDTILMEQILDGLRSNGLTDYYGAVATSPKFFEMVVSNPAAGALSGLMRVSKGHHSPAAADAAALAACNTAARGRGAPACAISARILPKKWEPRDFTLSAAATAAFRKYRRAKAPKAFAISASGAAFGFVSAERAAEEARQACASNTALGGGADCQVVLVD